MLVLCDPTGGYYAFEEEKEIIKKKFFEFIQADAEVCLERLTEAVETELEHYFTEEKAGRVQLHPRSTARLISAPTLLSLECPLSFSPLSSHLSFILSLLSLSPLLSALSFLLSAFSFLLSPFSSLLSPLSSPLPFILAPLSSLLSPLASRLSPLTSHLSPLTSHLSPLTSHLSPLTSHHHLSHLCLSTSPLSLSSLLMMKRFQTLLSVSTYASTSRL